MPATKAKKCRKITSVFNDQAPYLYEEFERPCDAMAWAKNYLKMVGPCAQRGAIVLDIDGTLLTRGPRDGVHKNQCVVGVFNMARELKLPVYVVTARPESKDNREYTYGELEKVGVARTDIVRLYMMPNVRWENDPNYSDWKASTRESIARKHQILLNVGDQWSDMMRLNPYAKLARDKQISDFLESRLPNDAPLVLKVPDVAWMSIKLPSE